VIRYLFLSLTIYSVLGIYRPLCRQLRVDGTNVALRKHGSQAFLVLRERGIRDLNT